MNKPKGLKNGLVLENLFVTKLTSLSPDNYEFIGLTKAIQNYGEYCRNFQAHYQSRKLDVLGRLELKCKTFDDWCLTEI